MAADLTERLRARREAWRPPPDLALSDWADEYFYLSAESAAEPGRWHTLPYQREIMDALTDPTVERVSWMKSARVGATKIMNAFIAYLIKQEPCPILLAQPTVEDAEGYSKEEIAPMLRDCPALAGLVRDRVGKSAAQTILHKTFPGGLLSMVGANSGRGFRRVSRRVVIFDEVDAYPPSAGSEGDQIKLGIKRTEFYANRKIYAASTPLIAGASRIEEMFEAGDQRRYYVPCPQCGHMGTIVFAEPKSRPGGHWMTWPEGQPEEAHLVCGLNGCVIEEKNKRKMLEAGEWRAARPFRGHASFHIWAAYSVSPNATWGQIATEFLACKDRPEELKTWVNTTLGETWKERGEAPDWERLYLRREPYQMGRVPAGVHFLTAGVDVQKDRFVYEVVGWALNKETWSIDYGELYGDTSDERTWTQLDTLLSRTFDKDGSAMSIAMLAVDAGYNAQEVYTWARRYPMNRVIAVRGKASARTLLNTPSAVDVTIRGKQLKRGYKVWNVGVSIGKSELYGWLRLPRPTEGEPAPGGYCHFPEYSEEYFKQLTAEHLVTVTKRTGFTQLEWQVLPNRQNHVLDCRVYARAAAAALGIDRMKVVPATPPRPQATPAPSRDSVPERTAPRRSKGGWLQGGRGGGWLGRRR